MRLYRPTCVKAGRTYTSSIWWCEASFDGEMIRFSTGVSDYDEARKQALIKLAERIQAALAGEVRTIQQAAEEYISALRASRSAKTVETARMALRPVLAVFGRRLTVPPPHVDEIQQYVNRIAPSLSGRTERLRIQHLARVLGSTPKALWPKLRMPSEASDVGRALSDDEIHRILTVADSMAAGSDGSVHVQASDGRVFQQRRHSRGVLMPCYLRVLLLTGMRAGEAKRLQWRHVDLDACLIDVPGTKTSAARRRIPIAPALMETLLRHRQWYVEKFGRTDPEWYLFPTGSPQPADPRRPVSDLTNAWDSIRERAGVECRIHDLRHTFVSRLAEAGTPETTIMEIVGHVSRAMLLRYSHSRLEARRAAVGAIRLGA
jgi:integrase